MPIDRTLIRRTVEVYAQTLLDALKARGAVFDVSGELEQVLATIRGHVELRSVLGDKTIPGRERASIAQEVFCDFDPALVAVLAVLVERGELRFLSRINDCYIDLAEKELNAVFIDVTTAVELDDSLRSMIKEKYSAQFGRGVLLREHVDPAMLGGIVLSAHGNRIDASVNSLLENARNVLSKQW